MKFQIPRSFDPMALVEEIRKDFFPSKWSSVQPVSEQIASNATCTAAMQFPRNVNVQGTHIILCVFSLDFKIQVALTVRSHHDLRPYILRRVFRPTPESSLIIVYGSHSQVCIENTAAFDDTLQSRVLGLRVSLPI